MNLELDVREVMFPLDLYDYGFRGLASLHGGVGGTSSSSPSRTSKIVGGAMSGAAVGTAVNPGWGTAIGAIVGGVAGAAS